MRVFARGLSHCQDCSSAVCRFNKPISQTRLGRHRAAVHQGVYLWETAIHSPVLMATGRWGNGCQDRREERFHLLSLFSFESFPSEITRFASLTREPLFLYNDVKGNMMNSEIINGKVQRTLFAPFGQECQSINV